MTFKQLEVFVNVADTKSFSRGAEASCITQSTASQHIQGLEDELGVRLFDRGRGGALLTVAGKLFLARARKIITDCTESRSAIRSFLGMDGVVLNIGASTMPASCLIPAMLRPFMESCPGVCLDLFQADSQKVLRRLIEEEIELAFIGTRPDDERVEFHEVYRDEIICVASPDALKNGKETLSQAELCRVPLLVREQGSGTQKAVFEALARTWIRRDSLRVAAVLGSGDALRAALLQGCGYAFVSQMSVEPEIAAGRLVRVRIPGVAISRVMYAAHRQGRELSPAAALFLENMLKYWDVSNKKIEKL